MTPLCQHWIPKRGLQGGGGCAVGVADGQPAFRTCGRCLQWEGEGQINFAKWCSATRKDPPKSVSVKQIKSFAKALITGEYVSQEIVKERMEICQSCDRVRKQENGEFSCGICGCKVSSENKKIRNLAAYKEELPSWGCKHPDRDKGKGWRDHLKKIKIVNKQSPGDILLLTAAVRDLKLAYPEYQIEVDTSCKDLWANNPYVVKFDKNENIREIKAEYPLVNQSNSCGKHFIYGFLEDLENKLNIKIPLTRMAGDIYLTDKEKEWPSDIEGIGEKRPFWIMICGGKFDFTAKWPNPNTLQEVVNARPDITFFQCGEKNHKHFPLENCVNLIGKTNLRQFIRLMYHAEGVICPVTFAMHLAATFDKKCIVIAGGREPVTWEKYPNHHFLNTIGQLDCCKTGGCWKSRCQLVGDGDKKDTEALCKYPEDSGSGFKVAKCINMIPKEMVLKCI